MRFVRVACVPDDGTWRLEAGAERSTWPTREAALDQARALAPEWIEVGDVREGRHTWTTLRRQADGGYEESRLRWSRGG